MDNFKVKPLQLKYIQLTENEFPPVKGSLQSAGYDLKSAYDYIVPKHGRQLILTDLTFIFPENCFGRISPRSGLALKNFIDVGAGDIDKDYHGNVGVLLFNHSDEDFTVNRGDRIAQLICEVILYPELKQVTVFESTERNSKGFGSTENGNNINPSSNFQLAQAIEMAKEKDMPISSIQNTIKSTQVDKDVSKPSRYSIKGPKGSVLLVTALTKSHRKTKQDLALHLKKVGGIISDTSLEGNFDRKGLVLARAPPNIENIQDLSVDHAIEAEAEEVSLLDEDKKLTFVCEISKLHQVRTKLQELEYIIEESKITFVPKMKVNLGDDEMELMSKIISKLEEHPEVVDISDNIA